MSFIHNTIAALALSGALAGAAAAAPTTVDQSQLTFNLGMPFEFHFPGFDLNNYPVGQSYTAGIGRTLTGITIFCNGSCDLAGLPNTLTLNVYAGGGVGGSLLGSVTQTPVPVPVPSLFGLPSLRFDVSSLGIVQTVGTQYSFAVTSVTGPGALATRGILQNANNPYAGGQTLPSGGYGDQPNWDLMFTTEVAGVPEPASWALMIGGFGLVGSTLRRRRTQLA
jgi:hypothetical protein